jgi:hypothetical protein
MQNGAQPTSSEPSLQPPMDASAPFTESPSQVAGELGGDLVAVFAGELGAAELVLAVLASPSEAIVTHLEVGDARAVVARKAVLGTSGIPAQTHRNMERRSQVPALLCRARRDTVACAVSLDTFSRSFRRAAADLLAGCTST